MKKEKTYVKERENNIQFIQIFTNDYFLFSKNNIKIDFTKIKKLLLKSKNN